MGYDSLQFLLGQELPFLAVWADMKLRKRVTGNLAVVMRPQHNTFQPHTPLPDSAVSQSSVCTEVGGKVLDKLRCQFKHRHIPATVVRLNELCHIFPRTLHSPESACSPVLAHTLLLIGNVLIESTQQRFVLAAETLIGVAHHLCRNKSFHSYCNHDVHLLQHHTCRSRRL